MNDSTNGPKPSLEALWDRHRRRVLDVAYRMLGSVADAEDVVQESYERLMSADLDHIDDVGGWLVTVASRRCIDRLRAHEQSRRAYVGPWLPEPVVSFPSNDRDLADRVTLDESVRMALLVVLERLSPAERTAYVLHDVFGLGFAQIGEIVGRSPQACRQLASRARRRVQADDSVKRFEADRASVGRVAARFARACEAGDFEALVEVLDPDVLGDFDSGGIISAAPLQALEGAHRVARQLVATVSNRGATFLVADVNGEPGVIMTLGHRVLAVISIGVHRGRIDLVHGIGNPHKLAHLTLPS